MRSAPGLNGPVRTRQRHDRTLPQPPLSQTQRRRLQCGQDRPCPTFAMPPSHHWSVQRVLLHRASQYSTRIAQSTGIHRVSWVACHGGNPSPSLHDTARAAGQPQPSRNPTRSYSLHSLISIAGCDRAWVDPCLAGACECARQVNVPAGWPSHRRSGQPQPKS